MTVRLYEGIKAFIQEFAYPKICPDLVIRGDQQNAVLPNADNFCVFRPLVQKRISKTQDSVIKDSDASLIRDYSQIDFQIDFYGRDSYERARSLELLAESHRADTFLETFGIDALFTSDVQNVTGVLDDNQLTERWMFTFTVGFCNDVVMAQGYATSVTPALIEVNATFQG